MGKFFFFLCVYLFFLAAYFKGKTPTSLEPGDLVLSPGLTCGTCIGVSGPVCAQNGKGLSDFCRDLGAKGLVFRTKYDISWKRIDFYDRLALLGNVNNNSSVPTMELWELPLGSLVAADFASLLREDGDRRVYGLRSFVTCNSLKPECLLWFDSSIEVIEKENGEATVRVLQVNGGNKRSFLRHEQDMCTVDNLLFISVEVLAEARKNAKKRISDKRKILEEIHKKDGETLAKTPFH